MYLSKVTGAFLSFILLSQSLALTQENPAPKDETKTAKTEVSDVVKEKAYKLLAQVANESSQFIIPQNRVYFQIITAGLMWDHDEKQARAMFLNAQTELRSMIDQMELKANQAAAEEAETPATNQDELINEYDARTLREQLVLALAEHDPKAALDALQGLKPSPGFESKEGANPLSGEDALELKISAAIVQKDPNRAFEVAKANLAKGFPDNMLEVLSDIYKKDSELGAKFAKEIFGKIKVSKIQTSEAANVASPTNGGEAPTKITPEISIWIASQFLKTASQSLKTAEKANKAGSDKKTVPLLSEAEVREIAVLIAQKFVSQTQIYPSEVGNILPELTKYVPTQAQIIKRKLGTEGAKQAEDIANSSAEYEENSTKTAAETAQDAERATPDKRDYLYSEAVRKAMDANDPENARKYFAKIKEQASYEWLKNQIDEASLLDKARSGNIEEVHRLIVKNKTADEKISALCELARGLAAKGDKKTAGQLIDEAKTYLPARFKTSANLASYIEVVRGAAFVSEEQSFAFLENSFSAVNELIAAAVLLDDFNQYGSTRQDELNYDAMERQALRNFPNSVEVISKLAESDFDRTAGLADKFTRSDIRAFARLRIVQALLDEKAAEKEATAAEQSQGGEGDY